ncbi:hypothetical protein SAMN04488691_10159 [Haloferax larsenii]|uniref:Uncharacterized protein n=1 Tax=Haloferax larsenii TaxID=302484 RepID=A0A1H7FLZ4_HALLR|nr:hypothetical protein SAMN04488691_10159 [Haloferax larsenii]
MRWSSGVPSSPLALAALVAANGLPLAGVVWFDWSLKALLFAYWLESAVVGLVNVPKILAACGSDDEDHFSVTIGGYRRVPRRGLGCARGDAGRDGAREVGTRRAGTPARTRPSREPNTAVGRWDRRAVGVEYWWRPRSEVGGPIQESASLLRSHRDSTARSTSRRGRRVRRPAKSSRRTPRAGRGRRGSQRGEQTGGRGTTGRRGERRRLSPLPW